MHIASLDMCSHKWWNLTTICLVLSLIFRGLWKFISTRVIFKYICWKLSCIIMTKTCAMHFELILVNSSYFSRSPFSGINSHTAWLKTTYSDWVVESTTLWSLITQIMNPVLEYLQNLHQQSIASHDLYRNSAGSILWQSL